MHKRTSTGAISSPTAIGGDGFGANSAPVDLASWAYRGNAGTPHPTGAREINRAVGKSAARPVKRA